MPHSVSSDVPASLPPFEIPKGTDVVEVASRFVESLASQSLDNLEEGHFLQTAIWRDLFALTGTLRTFYTSPSIFAAWQEVTASNRAGSFKVFPASAHLIPVANGWIDVNFSFETDVAPAKKCSGMLSLVPDADGKWVIWMLRTIWDGLKELEGLDVETLRPVNEIGSTNGHTNGHTNGSTNGFVNGHTNGYTNRHANGHPNGHETSQNHELTNGNINGVTNCDIEETPYECVVVGGGQCGLTVAGRLKALNVKYVLLEKNEKIGDNWAKRYNSVKLHTIRDSAQLPFDNTFTEKDSEWLTKDDLARGYAAWTAKYGINVWTSTELISGTWDLETALWTLRIRQVSDEKTIQASNVVLANGSGGHTPLPVPKYSNRENFKGTVMHSSEYKSPASWKGKHGIVIGTGNTAHDVTEDMVDAGLASTTMVQRGSTYVYPQAYYSKPSAALYSQLGTKNADTATRSMPLAVFSLMASHGNKAEQMKEPHRYDALEKAGFKLEREGDIVYHLFGRAGGHYMDVGASDKIAAGLIKMKSDALPVSYTETGLLFSDGVELPADLIVFATGFVKNMRLSIIPIFGEKVANQMGDYWGLDEELEVKGAYKTCGHPALWYHGGDQSQARYYSKFVALQIKARLLGTPVKIYSETPKSVLRGR